MSTEQRIGGRTKDCPFAQWEFEISNVCVETPAWTDEEMAVISEVFDRRLTAWQQPNLIRGFRWWGNIWLITKQQRSDGLLFMATKATWRTGFWSGNTAEALAQFIDEHF